MNVVVVSSKCPFWNDLTDEEKLSMLKSAKTVRYRKGEIISSYGAIFLISGLLRSYIVTDEGKELTIGHIMTGDMLFIPSVEVSKDFQFEIILEAADTVELVKIPLDVMANIEARNHRAALYILKTSAKRYVKAINSIQSVMSKSLEARIAEYLSFRADSNQKLVLKVTHEDIAKCISSSREVVTKEMKKMVANGLVELRRGIVIIKDLQKMKAIQ